MHACASTHTHANTHTHKMISFVHCFAQVSSVSYQDPDIHTDPWQINTKSIADPFDFLFLTQPSAISCSNVSFLLHTSNSNSSTICTNFTFDAHFGTRVCLNSLQTRLSHFEYLVVFFSKTGWLSSLSEHFDWLKGHCNSFWLVVFSSKTAWLSSLSDNSDWLKGHSNSFWLVERRLWLKQLLKQGL